MTVKKGRKLFRCWIADIIMTFYIFCSLYQRVVLISTIPYGIREVSTLMQGIQALILLRLNSSGYLLIWILWLKENPEAGDNGCIFCRTSWFIRIICTNAGREANCTWTMCLSLPRSAAEVSLLTSAKDGYNEALRKISIHSRSSQEKCLGVNLWGFQINAVMTKKLKYMLVRSPGCQVFVCWKKVKTKNKNISQCFQM